MRRMFTLTAVLFLFFHFLTPDTGYSQNEPFWSASFDRDIEWMELTDAGILLVNTKNAMSALDPETGAKFWSHDDLRKIDRENVEIIKGTPFFFAVGKGLGTLKPYYIVDSITGKIIVDSKELGFRDVADKFLMLEVGGILIADLEGNLKMVQMNDASLMWEKQGSIDGDLNMKANMKILGRSTDKGVQSSFINFKDKTFLILSNKKLYRVDGKTGNFLWNHKVKNARFSGFNTDGSVIYVSSGDEITAVDAETGKALWAEEGSVKGDKVKQVFNTNSGLVVWTNDKKRKLHKLDYATGKGLWDPPKIKDNISFMTIKEGTGIIAGFSGKSNEIRLYDLQTGEEKWDAEIGEGAVHEMKKIPAGLLAITSERANILDLNTGDEVLDDKAIRTKEGDLLSLSEGNSRIIYADEKLYSLNTTDASFQELAEDIEFEEKEVPSSFEKQDNGYLLSSSQNLMLLGPDFQQQYHTFFEAPGRGAFTKAAMGVFAAASAAAAVGQGLSSGYATSTTVGNSTMTTYGVNKQSVEYANMMGNMAGSSLGAMGDRFKASKNAENYVYMLVDKIKKNGEKGEGLVKVSKENGEVLGKVVLDNKEPKYKIDEIDEMIYYMVDDDIIYGYNL